MFTLYVAGSPVAGSLAFQSKGATASDSDILRFVSSGSVSHTELPSSVEPLRGITPARNNNASATDVLPLPLCPTNATFLMRSVDGLFNGGPPPDLVRLAAPAPQ